MKNILSFNFLNEYLNVKLLMITISITIAYLFSVSKNNLILKRKY